LPAPSEVEVPVPSLVEALGPRLAHGTTAVEHMRVAIIGKAGVTVGWFEEDTVLDLLERPRGYVLDGGIFDYHGRYHGAFELGVFKDPDGHAVGRLEGTSGPIDSHLDWEAYFLGEDAPDGGLPPGCRPL
jgi:hypothetical protein